MPALQPLLHAPRAVLAGIRLLATDIDDTMTRHGKLVPEVLVALGRLRAGGVEVLPITGRPAGEALGLARYLPDVTRAVAENGASLVLPDEPVEHLQPPADRPVLLAVAAQLGHLGRPWTLAPDAFCRVGDVAWLREGRPLEELVLLRAAARAHGVHLVWSSVHIHLSHHEPDKGQGVLEVGRRLGYAPDTIATIGDSPNDAGLWRPHRFGLTVGTAAVVHQQAAIDDLPDYVVAEAADGWLELADALLAARA